MRVKTDIRQELLTRSYIIWLYVVTSYLEKSVGLQSIKNTILLLQKNLLRLCIVTALGLHPDEA